MEHTSARTKAPESAAEPEEERHVTMASEWRRAVFTMYPDVNSKTYFVPPVYFCRVPYEGTQEIIGRQRVLVHKPAITTGAPASSTTTTSKVKTQEATGKPVYHSEVREDFAQQHVLHCIKEIANHEIMFVLSQFDLASYLNKQSYGSATAGMPKPSDLKERGDCDVIIIHRKYGILVGEIKSVGQDFENLNETRPTSDCTAKKKLKKAIKQLRKIGAVIRHILDDDISLKVKKTIILPYIKLEQLQRVLTADTELSKAMCECIEAPDEMSAARLCLCADQMSDPASPWRMTPAMSEELSAWWRRRMACTTDPAMSDDVYLDIVSRFVGPATSVSVHCVVPPRVEVRTEGEAVSEVGERMARVVLTPHQFGLASRPQRMVCLTGPPGTGTGKTLLLVLKGLRWLRQGHDVHVVSWYFGTLAASRLIYHMLQMSLKDDPSNSTTGYLHFHQYDIDIHEEDVETAVKELTDAATTCKEEKGEEKLFVLIDEAKFSYGPAAPRVCQLVSKLSASIPELFLWTATLCKKDIPLQKELLTYPLRCPPVVQREMDEEVKMMVKDGVPEYTPRDAHAPADGPPVIHRRHEGQGHSCQLPVECVGCGKEVARVLRDLDVGGKGTASGSTNINSSPPPLQYKDVFVLTRSTELCDDIIDVTGKVTSKACGFVRGLREANIPVSVLGWVKADRKTLEKNVADVARAGKDEVIATDITSVHGLERKVVVYLPGRRLQQRDTPGVPEHFSDNIDKVRAVSRCTSQLIMVKMP